MENALVFFSEEIKLKCKVKLNFILNTGNQSCD